MRILVDANVLLDVMCQRDPARREFAPDSGAVLDWCEANAAGAVAWHTLDVSPLYAHEPLDIRF